MELQSITAELRQAAADLREKVAELFSLAVEKAEAEKVYRQALAREIFKLRDEKIPVSIIGDMARGNIAEEKFKRDLAEAKYTAGREALASLQSQVSALQSVLRYQEHA